MTVRRNGSSTRRRQAIAALVGSLASILLVTSGASAAFPGKNGPIVWMDVEAGGVFQIFTSRADLTHTEQLTRGESNSGWPVWSPDMNHIAFDSDRSDPDRTDDVAINDVFTMRPDGTKVKNLTDGIGFNGDAAYSPDGHQIAFEADLGDYPAKQGIYLMDAKDGRHKYRITTTPGDGYFDGAPRFSPDGKWLVFTRFFTPPGGDEISDLYVVRRDGTDLHRITPHGRHPGDADWSPDGKLIVFEADFFNGRGDAWVVRPDGTGLRSLTFRPSVPGLAEGFSDPTFSPDGKLVMLIHGLFHSDGSHSAGLATIHVDGTDLSYVADGLGEEHQPDWGRAKH